MAQSADLPIHGRLAAVLASMEALQEHTANLRAQHKTNTIAGKFKDQSEKLAYLNRFNAILAKEETG